VRFCEVEERGEEGVGGVGFCEEDGEGGEHDGERPGDGVVVVEDGVESGMRV
jgi:hypothetical protein